MLSTDSIQLGSWHDITPGIFLPARSLRRTLADTTSSDILCVSALPDTRHHHDATQSLRLLTCDHLSRERATIAETAISCTRPPTDNRQHHALSNGSFFYSLSTRAQEARRTTLLLELSECLLRVRTLSTSAHELDEPSLARLAAPITYARLQLRCRPYFSL